MAMGGKEKPRSNGKQREYVPFFRSFYEALSDLDDDNDQLSLYRAIVGYGLDGTEPANLTGFARILWKTMLPILRNSRKKFENGLKGGAPKGNKNAAKRDRERVLEPPTPNELSEFCNAHGYDIDEEYFCAHYESIGWVTTNYRVNNWRDAVREWVATGSRNGYDD